MQKATVNEGFWDSHRTLKRALSHRLVVSGLIVFLGLVVAAAIGPYFMPHDPVQVDIPHRVAPPSFEHPFGTDDLGRDVFSRVLYGARISLLVGLASIGFALGIGLPVGLVAGYLRGWFDMAVMRVMDSIYAFPSILLALAIVAVLGRGIENVIVAIGVVYIPNIARVTRGITLSEREKTYVLAERAIGASNRRIVFRHILPNAISPVIIQASLYLAFAIVVEASLSFLGLGVPPPFPSWGRMVSEGRNWVEMAPWMILSPGIILTVSVLGINMLGIGLTDILNPRLRKR